MKKTLLFRLHNDERPVTRTKQAITFQEGLHLGGFSRGTNRIHPNSSSREKGNSGMEMKEKEWGRKRRRRREEDYEEDDDEEEVRGKGIGGGRKRKEEEEEEEEI